MSKLSVQIVFFIMFIVPAISFSVDEKIIIDNPWIRAAPPTSKVLGGYFNLENKTGKKLKLMGVTSSDFESVEMHKTENINGMFRMKKQSGVDIEIGGILQFKPSSYHLMLMKPKHKISEGDKIKIEFKFANGKTIATVAEVRRGEAKSAKHGNDGHGQPSNNH